MPLEMLPHDLAKRLPCDGRKMMDVWAHSDVPKRPLSRLRGLQATGQPLPQQVRDHITSQPGKPTQAST